MSVAVGSCEQGWSSSGGVWCGIALAESHEQVWSAEVLKLLTWCPSWQLFKGCPLQSGFHGKSIRAGYSHPFAMLRYGKHVSTWVGNLHAR